MDTPESIPSADEKRRAFELARARLCPHCGQAISLADACSMVQGAGFESWVHVQIEDGRILPMRLTDVNPQTMRIIE